MASLLSATEKQQLGSVFNDIHDTFARDIVIIKNEQRVIITENVNYNYFYSDNQSIEDVEYIPVSGIFKGRIKWMDIENKNVVSRNENFQPSTFSNYCRIKIDPSGYNFMTGCKEVWVDNIKCDWEGQIRPHGLFDIQYYTIYVRASE